MAPPLADDPATPARSLGVTPAWSPAEQPGREKQQSPKQREYAAYRDADKTQRQRQEPNQGKKDKCQ